MLNHNFIVTASSPQPGGTVALLQTDRDELAKIVPTETLKCIDIALTALSIKHLLRGLGAKDVEVGVMTGGVDLGAPGSDSAADRRIADLRRTIDVQEKRLADLTQELSVRTDAQAVQEIVISGLRNTLTDQQKMIGELHDRAKAEKERADDWKACYERLLAKSNKVATALDEQ